MKLWKLTNKEFEPWNAVEDGVWGHASAYEEVEPLVKTAVSTVIMAGDKSYRLFVTDKSIMTVSDAEAGKEVRHLVKALMQTFIQPKFATVDLSDLFAVLRTSSSFHVVNVSDTAPEGILHAITKAPGLGKTKSAVLMLFLSAEWMDHVEELHTAFAQTASSDASLVWGETLSDGENGISAAMMIGDE